MKIHFILAFALIAFKAFCANVTLMVDTNGTINAPTNFFRANTNKLSAALNGVNVTNIGLRSGTISGTFTNSSADTVIDGAPGGGGGVWPRSFTFQNFNYIQNSQANSINWYGKNDATISGGNLYLTTYTNLIFNTPEIASFSLTTNAVPVLVDPVNGYVKFVPLEQLQLGTTITSGKIIGKSSIANTIVSGTVSVTDVASAANLTTVSNTVVVNTSAIAIRARQASTVAAMQALTGVADGDQVVTAGRTTAGDGGGATFYYSASSAATTNYGAIFTATGMGSGRYLWNGAGTLDARMFGVVPNNPAAPDYSVQLQSAIDYSESSGVGKLFLSPGITVAQIVLRSTKLYGVRPTSTAFISTNVTSILVQPVSPTDATIVITNNPAFPNSTPELDGIYVLGRGDITTPNKKAITVVDSQYVFRVANADAPTLYVSTDSPSQVAMFYDNQARYLGSGFVTGTSVSGGDTIITLDSAYSTFASTTSTGWLTTANTVVFAVGRTVGSTTYADAASAGYAGIRIAASFSAKINNVTVDKHHVGISVQTTGASSMFRMNGDNGILHCEYAGLMSDSHTGLIDAQVTGALFVGGTYGPAGIYYLGYSAGTNTITNPLLRNTSWGCYNAFSIAHWPHIVTDGCVGGAWTRSIASSRIDYLLFDNIIRYGGVFKDGYYTSIGGSGLSIGHLEARANYATNAYLNASFARSAITVDGTIITNQIRIGTLSVPQLSGGGLLDNVFSVSGISGHSITVAQKITTDGARAIGTWPNNTLFWLTPSDASGPTQQTDGWWTAGGTSGLSHSATNVITVTGTSANVAGSLLLAANPTVALGAVTKQYVDVVGTLATNAATAANLTTVSNTAAAAYPKTGGALTGTFTQTPASDATNINQINNAAGQPRFRVDTVNGRTYVIGVGGAEGVDPTFSSGTTFVVKNNVNTSDRARLSVIGGSAGYSVINFGFDLGGYLQYDNSASTLTLGVGSNSKMFFDSQGRISIGSSATTPDAESTMDFQTTLARAVYFPRMTTTLRDTIGTPKNGFVLANSTLNTLNYHNGTRWYSLSRELSTVSTSLATAILTALTPVSSTVTVTGAVAGDQALVTPNILNGGNTLVHGVVTANNTVTIYVTALVTTTVAQTNTVYVKVIAQ